MNLFAATTCYEVEIMTAKWIMRVEKSKQSHFLDDFLKTFYFIIIFNRFYANFLQTRLIKIDSL